jgi:RNA methyltransferase, TrmH family
LFVVEGIHTVGEAVAAGWEIEAILYSPDKLRSEFALGLLSGYPGRIERVASETLKHASGKENPQGILAIVHQRHRNLAELAEVSCGAALVSPQDPGNVGTIVRTLDAIGGDALFLLDGGVDPYHPTMIRASMGTSFWVPVIEASFEEFVDWCRQRSCELIGTSAREGRHPRDFRPATPWILLLGSEQKGLSAAQKQQCGSVLSLPMQGRAGSLNLAVAAGIFLYSLST